jgi:predicted nucleic acid-binding protein
VTLLADSNVWIAAQDRQNRDHGACSALLLEHAGRLAATVPVIVETAWFIEDRHGPARESEFLRLVTSGVVQAIDLTLEDWARSVELIVCDASAWSRRRFSCCRGGASQAYGHRNDERPRFLRS